MVRVRTGVTIPVRLLVLAAHSASWYKSMCTLSSLHAMAVKGCCELRPNNKSSGELFSVSAATAVRTKSGCPQEIALHRQSCVNVSTDRKHGKRSWRSVACGVGGVPTGVRKDEPRKPRSLAYDARPFHSLRSHAGKSPLSNIDVHARDLVLCRSAARPPLTLDVLHAQSHNPRYLPRTLETCTRHPRRSIWLVPAPEVPRRIVLLRVH